MTVRMYKDLVFDIQALLETHRFRSNTRAIFAELEDGDPYSGCCILPSKRAKGAVMYSGGDRKPNRFRRHSRAAGEPVRNIIPCGLSDSCLGLEKPPHRHVSPRNFGDAQKQVKR